MLPPPSTIVPLDPDEFLGVCQYAGMIAENEFLEEVPAIGRPFVETDEGPLALTNIWENRFGLAVARHFRGQPERMQSFMWRFWALQKLYKHNEMKKYTRPAGDQIEINDAVFEVAATQKLSDEYEFKADAFFEEVSRVAAIREAEEANG